MNNSRSLSNDIMSGPKLQQWAIISKHRALEDQKYKEMQKMQQYYKKMKFKSDLDQQLSNKNNSHLQDQQSDRKYYQYLIQKGVQHDEREEKLKMEKLQKRRSMQSHNRQVTQTLRNSRDHDSRPGYELDIGLKSQIQQRLREQKGKRQMMDTLDVQIKRKQEQNLLRKMQDGIKDVQHFQKQANMYGNNRNNKSYKQDQRVFHHYQHLMDDKHKKQQQLDKQFIDEAARRKNQQQARTKNYEQRRKQQLANSMKQTLDQQVKIYNYKKNEEKTVNPQDISYGFISNVFREKPPSYDKIQYYQDLRKQAEQQKQRKQKSSFMSEEEYKYNRNQLNKIVNGQFAHEKYLDRSMGAIGQKKIVGPVIDDENSSFIRDRLQNLRGNQRAGNYSPMSYSKQ